jgi:hypothetical protein
MSMADDLKIALRELHGETGEYLEEVKTGKQFPAINTSQTVDSELMSGIDLQQNQMLSRVFLCDMPTKPRLQTHWKTRGKCWKLVDAKITLSSILLTLEDTQN